MRVGKRIDAHSCLPKNLHWQQTRRSGYEAVDAGPQRSMAKLKVRKATLPWLFVGLSCVALLVLHRSTSHLATDRDAHYKEELQRLRALADAAQITTHQTTRPPAPAAAAAFVNRPTVTQETTTTKKLWLAVGLPTVPRLNDEDYLGTTLNAFERELFPAESLLAGAVGVFVVNVHGPAPE